jgi:hypothetical protein
MRQTGETLEEALERENHGALSALYGYAADPAVPHDPVFLESVLGWQYVEAVGVSGHYFAYVNKLREISRAEAARRSCLDAAMAVLRHERAQDSEASYPSRIRTAMRAALVVMMRDDGYPLPWEGIDRTRRKWTKAQACRLGDHPRGLNDEFCSAWCEDAAAGKPILPIRDLELAGARLWRRDNSRLQQGEEHRVVPFLDEQQRAAIVEARRDQHKDRVATLILSDTQYAVWDHQGDARTDEQQVADFWEDVYGIKTVQALRDRRRRANTDVDRMIAQLADVDLSALDDTELRLAIIHADKTRSVRIEVIDESTSRHGT